MAAFIAIGQANPLPNRTLTTCSARFESCGETRPCCGSLNCVDPSTIREDLHSGKIALNGGVIDSEEEEEDDQGNTGALQSDYDDLPTDPSVSDGELNDDSLEDCTGDGCLDDDYLSDENDNLPGICVAPKLTAWNDEPKAQNLELNPTIV